MEYYLRVKNNEYKLNSLNSVAAKLTELKVVNYNFKLYIIDDEVDQEYYADSKEPLEAPGYYTWVQHSVGKEIKSCGPWRVR